MRSKLLSIIPKKYRGRAAGVIVTIFLRALLNFVGIATLIPVLILILDSNNVTSNPQIHRIYDILGVDSYEMFVIVVCALVVALIAFKNILVLLLYRYERDFIYALYKHLSENLYISYHNRGLSFVKRNNSAILTRNVNVVSLMFVAGVLKPIASIVSEILLLMLIMGALLWYNYTAALIAACVFLPIIAIFYLTMRRRLNDIGERENEEQRTKSRIVAETFRGYADIEIGGAFPQMMQRFEKSMNEVVALRKRNATIGMLPLMFTEVGLAIGLATLMLISLSDNGDTALMFGIFAVAAIRLIPSIKNIMSSWSAIRYNRYSISTLADADINEKEIAPEQCNERLTFEREISIEGLSFRFDDAEINTIDNLSLRIKKGERVGIKGSSGAGKTTLFNLILGLYPVTSGAIYVDGMKLDSSNIRKWQNTIGYVSQSVFITDGTLVDNITLGHDTKNIDYNRVNEVIKLANLSEFVSTLPNGIDSRIGEQGSRLSGGQRQRIGIARALYKNSDVLFFDEATSALDDRTEENINNAIRTLSNENRALTIVVIAHRDSSLEYCDRIISLD